MRRLILSVMLACAMLSAEAADLIEHGAEDLLKNAALSQPFTVLDQLLLSINREAVEVAKNFHPENNDFRPSKLASVRAVSSDVVYDKPSARTAITFSLYVSGIDDPWRDVCAKRVTTITGPANLWLPTGEAWDVVTASNSGIFFSKHLGHRIVSTDTPLGNYKPFSDSIVVGLTFYVEGEDAGKKTLKFMRQCFWDNKTGQVYFREHKY